MSNLSAERATWVFNAHTTLTGRMVLLILANRADDEGIAVAGGTELAKEAGISRASAYSALESLRDAGFISDMRPDAQRIARRPWRVNFGAGQDKDVPIEVAS